MIEDSEVRRLIGICERNSQMVVQPEKAESWNNMADALKELLKLRRAMPETIIPLEGVVS